MIQRLVRLIPGRPATPAMIRADIRTLLDTGWFFTVEPSYRETEAGVVVTYKVFERPILMSVEYKGNVEIGTHRLKALTGLVPGHAFNVSANKEAARRIEQHYHEKGYLDAKVTLEAGAREEDRDVIFVIDEGHKSFVDRIKFEGNASFSDALLRTQIKSQTRKLYLILGEFDPANIPNDIAAIKEYYQNLGYFDVKVRDEVQFSKEYRPWNNPRGRRKSVTITYHIDEGPRYTVRNVEFVGMRRLDEDEIRARLKVVPGEYFNARNVVKDAELLRDEYGAQGRILTKIDPRTQFAEEAGIVDVVYAVEEDIPRRIRMISPVVEGDYAHTKESTILNYLLFAPGDLANPKLIEKSRRRLLGSGLFSRDMMAGTAPKIDIKPVDESALFSVASDLRSVAQASRTRTESRGQDAERRAAPTAAPTAAATAAATEGARGGSRPPAPPARQPPAPRDEHRGGKPAPGARRFEPKSPQYDAAPKSAAEDANTPIAPQDGMYYMPVVIRSQSPDDPEGPLGLLFRAQDPFRNGPAADPLIRSDPRGDPYGNVFRDPAAGMDDVPGWVDVTPRVTETQTGRFMFGVGVNSDLGLVGSVVLDEANFDILRPPTSIRDVVNGTAWRGGGQHFRMEAVPGNQLSRYLVSWSDPFFLNTQNSLSLSGFYYTRIFEDWNEVRGGGSVGIGRQFTPFLSSSVRFRLEDVEIKHQTVPTPPILQRAVGHNFLSTVRVNLVHDTRDSDFLATEGHYLEAAYEQGFGDFVYPHVSLEGRQYFTVFERLDGEGRHILSLRGLLEWTGDDTPIFERLYAGGYQSFRGFRFRGVRPVEGNVGIGGQFMALGSVEYMAPVTADEAIRVVAFSDFGTVENDVRFSDFRATAGVGVRLSIAAMGPAPISLDLAWPITKQDFDDTRILSFFVGFQR